MGARLARFLGLPESLAEAVRLQRRQRGCSEAQRLLALLSTARTGGGCLRAVDALGADRVARRACGLHAVPPSRRLGASLQRRNRAAREGLQECVRLVSRRLTPPVARECEQRCGSVPVCGDGTAIEVEGRLCEHAERGYHGERQSWLHSVFRGPAGVSARLPAGGPDGQGEGREQLDRDVAPLLAAPQPVGLRAASAYSCKALGSSCRQRGWDAAVRGTAPRHKAPLLRQVAARELREDEWEPLDPESRERTTTGAYQPAGWPEEQVSVGIRRDGDGEQRLLAPVSTVMLGSQDRWPLAELVRLPRGQQGQENAFQGPLTDLGLQHPPCRSPAAQQGFDEGALGAPGGGQDRVEVALGGRLDCLADVGAGEQAAAAARHRPGEPAAGAQLGAPGGEVGDAALKHCDRHQEVAARDPGRGDVGGMTLG